MKNTSKFLIAIVLFASLIIFSFASGKFQTASALGNGTQGATSSDSTTAFRWQLSVPLTADAKDSIQRNNQSVLSSLQAKDVTSAISDSTLTLSGQQNLDQMRTALFNTASPLTDFLSGPVELTLYMPADSAPVTLNLEARLTTGSRWEVLNDTNSFYAADGDSTYAMMYPGIGVPSIQTIKLKPTGSGYTSVHLIYRRPFGPPEATHAKLNIWMPSINSTIDISNPNPVAPKAETSLSDSSTPNPYATLPDATLPTSWDWRNYGIVPDIRDQGQCGSCWAFGTVGSMESAIAKAGGGLQDLSEQFLNDCNTYGWNCETGGDTAHMFHYDTLGKNQSQIGAVLESADPYKAKDSICGTYSHPYSLTGWSYVPVGGNSYSKPTVDEIKNAIYAYGPVTTSVCADSGWDTYQTGVYAPTSNQCSGTTNHMVVLEGWDDATQSWIVRNSWGSWWGENGYMQIKYDPNYQNSHIGEDTSWVTVAPPSLPGAFGKISPSNGASSAFTNPTLQWGTSNGAAYYEYCYDTSSTCTNWTSAGISTSAALSGLIPSATYYWHVRAVNNTGTTYSDGDPTATWSFTVSSSAVALQSITFNSSGSYDGWVLESTSTSNLGGSINSSGTTFQLGDDAKNRQYKAILSFNTSSLPDNAVIQSAVLQINQSGLPVGTNPFNILGALSVDIRNGWFGLKPSLEKGDYSAAASATQAASFSATPNGGWYSANVTATDLTDINLTTANSGLTQFRLYFELTSNNNLKADLMKFLSGNYSKTSLRPQLIITYFVP